MLTQRDGSRSATPGRAARSWRVRRPWVIGYTAGVVVLAAATALVVALAGGQHRPPPPPAAARAFSLAELGHPGSTITLASYAGRPLIINFFASWCAPCQRETPMLARYYESQHGRVIVLGIDSNDETAAAVRFVRKTGCTTRWRSIRIRPRPRPPTACTRCRRLSSSTRSTASCPTFSVR